MKKYTLTLVFLLLTIAVSFAQYNYTAVPLMDYFRIEQMTEESLTKTLSEQHIQGSPYLEDEFKPGTVFTTTKNKVENVLLRYNIYNDDLEFKTPDNKILAIDKPETIELADFGDYQMVYLEYQNVNNNLHAFFKVIEKGKASLYAKPDVFFQKEVESDGIKPGKPAQFVQKNDIYYIKIGKDSAKEIGGKKDILTVMEDHNKEISDYLKKNKVKFSKGDQLQELVQYYNSL